MLIVDIQKKHSIEDLWLRGMIRASQNYDFIIMVVEDVDTEELRALVLKEDDTSSAGIVYNANIEHWIKRCPIVIEDTELILKGTVD